MAWNLEIILASASFLIYKLEITLLPHSQINDFPPHPSIFYIHFLFHAVFFVWNVINFSKFTHLFMASLPLLMGVGVISFLDYHWM